MQVKNEVEKLPRQQRKESLKQKMEEHAQKKQSLVSPCPSFGVEGLGSPRFETLTMPLCLCPAPRMPISYSEYPNPARPLVIPALTSPMRSSLTALTLAGSELSLLWTPQPSHRLSQSC